WRLFMNSWRFSVFVAFLVVCLISPHSYGQTSIANAPGKLLNLLSAPLKLAFSITTPATGCGTDANGNPTNNLTCGANGSSPYTGEGGESSLMSWCGGSVPGSCHA